MLTNSNPNFKSGFRNGLYMLAIIENLSRNPSHVTLGRFLTIASILGPLRNRDCRHFGPFYNQDCKYIWSLLKKIASILGPHCNHDCKLIWSLLWLRLQAYLVPVLKIIATMCPSLQLPYKCSLSLSRILLTGHF